MKSITIRGIDDDLSTMLRTLSKEKSKSINQFILDVLHRETGLVKAKEFTHRYHDLDHLFGSWSEEEYQQVEDDIQSQRAIDEELWS